MMAGGHSTPVSMASSMAPSADGSTSLQAVVELLHISPRQATARIASPEFEQLVYSQPSPRLLRMLEHVGSRLERRGDTADARALGVIRQLAERRGAARSPAARGTSPTPSVGSTVMDDAESAHAAVEPVVCGQCGQKNTGGAFCSACGARNSLACQAPEQAALAGEVSPSHLRLAQEEADGAREQAHQAANARGFYRLLYTEVRSGREHSEEVDGDVATGRAMDRVLGLLRSEEGRWAAVAPRLDFVYLLCSQASPQLLSMLEHNQQRFARAQRTADADAILTLIAAVRATLDGVTAENPANSATSLQTMHSPTLRQPGDRQTTRGRKEVEELAQGMQELNATLQVATGMAAQLGELSPAGEFSFQSDTYAAGAVADAPAAGDAELELNGLVNEALQSWGGGSSKPPPSANGDDDGYVELLQQDAQQQEAGRYDDNEEEQEFDEEIAKVLDDAAPGGDGSALVSQWIDDTAGDDDGAVRNDEEAPGADEEAANAVDGVEEPASPVLDVAFKPHAAVSRRSPPRRKGRRPVQTLSHVGASPAGGASRPLSQSSRSSSSREGPSGFVPVSPTATIKPLSLTKAAEALREPELEAEPEPEMSAVAQMLAAVPPPTAAAGRETLAQRAERLKKGREAPAAAGPAAAAPRAAIAVSAERPLEPAPLGDANAAEDDDDLHAQIMALG